MRALFGVDVLPIGTHTADRVVHAAVILQASLLLLYAAAILLPRRNGPADLLPPASLNEAASEPIAAT